MKSKSLAILGLTGLLFTSVGTAPLSVDAVTVANAKFTDVPTRHAYYNIIHEMRDQNIITGYLDGTFKPNQYITRQHAAALIGRVKGIELEVNKNFVKFKDVSESNPYFEDIKGFQQAGIIEADKLGNFYPNKPLTRGEMAKVIAEAFDLEITKNHPFPDVPTSHFAYNPVRALYSNGVTTGDNGMFKPSEPLSRAHYAVFMHRALKVENAPAEPVEPTDPNAPVSLLKQVQDSANANKDLFVGGVKPFSELALSNNPIATKMFIEGMSAVRENNLQFYTGYEAYGPEYDIYTANISLKSKGYKNPTERLGEMEFLFEGYGEDEASFLYDFRSDKAHNLTKAWLKITFPNLASELLPIIEEKVMETRLRETDLGFEGNAERIYIGNYEILVGSDSFFEFMAIQIQKQ